MRLTALAFTLSVAFALTRPTLAQPTDTLLPPPPPPPPDAVDADPPATSTPPSSPPTPASPPSPSPSPSPRPTPTPDSDPAPDSDPTPDLHSDPTPDSDPAPDFDPTLSPSEIPPPDAPRLRPPPPPRWYGWQIIVLDGTALANFATPYWPLSLPVYYLGAPITHLAHKAPVKAAISEGLRIAVPYATGLLGARFRHCDIREQDTCAHGIQPGAVLGAVAVSVFDITVLGQRSVLESVPAAPAPQTVSVSPGGTVDRHGFTLTASGTF